MKFYMKGQEKATV